MTFLQAAFTALKGAAEGTGSALIPNLDRTVSDNDVLCELQRDPWVGIVRGHRERLGLLKKRPLIRILCYQTRVPERGARDEG